MWDISTMINNVISPHDDQEARDMYESIIIENIQCFGSEWYYLPRTMLQEDKLLREDVHSAFNDAYQIEGLLTNYDAFRTSMSVREREGFFLDVKGNVVISKKRFNEVTSNQFTRPREGDLMYSPLYNIVFEIKRVIHDRPLYQLENLTIYELLIDRWEYNHDVLNTGIVAVDEIQHKYGHQVRVKYTTIQGTINVGDTVIQENEPLQIYGTVSKHDTVNKIISISDVTSNDGAYPKFYASTTDYLTTMDNDYVIITKVYEVDASLTDAESVHVMPHDITAQNQFVQKDTKNYYNPPIKKLF